MQDDDRVQKLNWATRLSSWTARSSGQLLESERRKEEGRTPHALQLSGESSPNESLRLRRFLFPQSLQILFPNLGGKIKAIITTNTY